MYHPLSGTPFFRYGKCLLCFRYFVPGTFPTFFHLPIFQKKCPNLFFLELDHNIHNAISQGRRKKTSLRFVLFTHIWLVVQIFFYFHPYLGKISNLTNIFQMGWNHQLDICSSPQTLLLKSYPKISSSRKICFLGCWNLPPKKDLQKRTLP